MLIAESNVLRTWLRSAHANFALHSAKGKPAALSACFVLWLLAAKLQRAVATGCTPSASPDSNILSKAAINTPSTEIKFSSRTAPEKIKIKLKKKQLFSFFDQEIKNKNAYLSSKSKPDLLGRNKDS